MEIEVKEKDLRKVYGTSGIFRELLIKAGIGIASFILGVTLTLMFYPILRP